jgi:hypothetical protein
LVTETGDRVRTDKLRHILGQTLVAEAKIGKGKKRDPKVVSVRYPHTPSESEESSDPQADPAASASSHQG